MPLIEIVTKIQAKCYPFLKLTLAFLMLICFVTFYCYSLTVKDIITGVSIFTPFNLTVLLFQLLAPIALLAFMCSVTLTLSRLVYQAVLSDSHSLSNDNMNPLSNDNMNRMSNDDMNPLSNEDMNRLSGDLRLLDRSLYFFSYATVLHLLNILASLWFSVVGLGFNWSGAGMLGVVAVTISLLTVCFTRFMRVRRQLYIK